MTAERREAAWADLARGQLELTRRAVAYAADGLPTADVLEALGISAGVWRKRRADLALADEADRRSGAKRTASPAK